MGYFRYDCQLSNDGILNEYVPLLVLDLGFDVIDGVRGLDLQRDGLASEGLNEDLHSIAIVSIVH